MRTQPEGIAADSNDLPEPDAAAERVRAYVTEWGDGRIDMCNGQPLYARDLESLARFILGTGGAA